MKNKVQALREQHHLTQAELAEKSGLSLRTIQRLEAGTIPKGYTLKAIAAALEVEPLYFTSEPSWEDTPLDLGAAKLVNVSVLSFLIVPFGNIIVPAILNYKKGNLGSKIIGREILGIQIIWTIINSLFMIISPFIQKALSVHVPVFIFFLIGMLVLNVCIVLKNAASLNQHAVLSIRLKNNIL